MSGYQDPDGENYFVRREDFNGVLTVLLAPVVVGGFLLFHGFSSGSHLLEGLGLLILLAVPAMIYIAWRRSY